MAELNEYQINQITTNIKQFSETYKELTYKISKSNLDRKFDKAVSNLKTYINDTKKAIQDAEKAFKIAIEGERPFFGLLSTNGLNDIINKKFSESSEVINKIIKENDDNIENIINSLPTIGKATNISGIYNSTEYAGDEDYSNNSIFDSVSESVSRTGGSSSLGFAFFNADFNEYNEDYSLEKENINETNYSSNEIFVTQGPTLIKCNSNDESIKIDENISIFSVGWFPNLISLKKIEFEKATELKMNLFSGCSNLKLIILPENVEIISPNAFRNIPDDCVICFKGEKDRCYEDDYREFQYLVMDYLITMQKYLTYDDVSKIFKYIKSKQWWDTIDVLDRIVGNIAFKDERINDLMLEWSKDEDLWVRRIAIDHQLCRKEKTNTELLEKIIVNNFGSNEFFINNGRNMENRKEIR